MNKQIEFFASTVFRVKYESLFNKPYFRQVIDSTMPKQSNDWYKQAEWP